MASLIAANRILGLACRFVCRALGLHLGATGDFTGCFLDGALDLIGGTFDAIFIHRASSFALASGQTRELTKGSKRRLWIKARCPN
jgi:hypothetical protein